MARVLLGTEPGPPQTRALLRIYLEMAGHQVQELCDGEALLAEVAAGAPPDVLVLDTALPNLDGFQVLARLQAQAATPRVPILVISAIPAQLGQRLVESMGAAAYLPKPFAFEALRLALDEALTAGQPTAASAAAPLGSAPANDALPPNGGGAPPEPSCTPDHAAAPGAPSADAHRAGTDGAAAPHGQPAADAAAHSHDRSPPDVQKAGPDPAAPEEFPPRVHHADARDESPRLLRDAAMPPRDAERERPAG